MTTQDDILTAGGQVLEPYDLNGTKVYIRSMPLGDYGPWLKGGAIEITPRNVARILARALCDEDGVRVFPDKDAAKLEQLDAGIAAELFGKVMSLSGLSEEAQEEAAESFSEAQNEEAFTG